MAPLWDWPRGLLFCSTKQIPQRSWNYGRSCSTGERCGIIKCFLLKWSSRCFGLGCSSSRSIGLEAGRMFSHWKWTTTVARETYLKQKGKRMEKHTLGSEGWDVIIPGSISGPLVLKEQASQILREERSIGHRWSDRYGSHEKKRKESDEGNKKKPWKGGRFASL